ncbi:response regulator [Magnetospirillum sp. XM-1]|uniref:response regulator n=1 Tax=Magnetospirillum sp. XM-1 TaxID=1663591 RepID=UPI000838F073|nr:response regulator [Magnetospirillum sp. XM-1]
MKLIRTRSEPPVTDITPLGPRHIWKLLVVDDESDVRQLTRISLRGFRFVDRDLEIIEAASAYEAREQLAQHDDIAVALIDVVMETDDAGLQLVEYIRKSLNNQFIRLIIRTGQPGLAPERYVIDSFDIDDYKDKTELTATRLYTTVRSALKSYRDLRAIEMNRIGLQHVLEAAPDIYRISNRSLNQFFQGVLTQIVGLCNLSDTSFISTIDGLIATFDEQAITIQATSGDLTRQDRFGQIRELCAEAVLSGQMPSGLRKDSYVVPLIVQQKPAGFIYVEPTQDLNEADRNLISMVAQQCSNALENLRLHINLSDSHDHMIDILAKVAEFKDRTTGSHIRRIDHYTQLVATELGLAKDEAVLFGKASRLHDVGKIGVADAILRKPGRLTDEEFAAVSLHTHIGSSILENDEFLRIARDVALHHHERWDGKGYPSGRPSREFHLATRIVSVVDVFDALVSRRSYKDPWEPKRAFDEIVKGAGTQFDPTVVSAFANLYEAGKLEPIIEMARIENDST